MQAGDYIVTAQHLRLREGPSKMADTLALMPQYCTFHADGGEQNGFASGTFGAVKGWAEMGNFSFVGGGAAGFDAGFADAGDITNATPEQIQNSDRLALTGQDVALRMNPAKSDPAFGAGSNVITTTNVNEVVQNNKIQDAGFQSVTYKGQDGWISVLYLRPTTDPVSSGSIVKTTHAAPVPVPAPKPGVQTELGRVSGPVAALGLLALGVGIYFLAK